MNLFGRKRVNYDDDERWQFDPSEAMSRDGIHSDNNEYDEWVPTSRKPYLLRFEFPRLSLSASPPVAYGIFFFTALVVVLGVVGAFYTKPSKPTLVSYLGWQDHNYIEGISTIITQSERLSKNISSLPLSHNTDLLTLNDRIGNVQQQLNTILLWTQRNNVPQGYTIFENNTQTYIVQELNTIQDYQAWLSTNSGWSKWIRNKQIMNRESVWLKQEWGRV